MTQTTFASLQSRLTQLETLSKCVTGVLVLTKKKIALSFGSYINKTITAILRLETQIRKNVIESSRIRHGPHP